MVSRREPGLRLQDGYFIVLVAADVRRRILAGSHQHPPPHLGGYGAFPFQSNGEISCFQAYSPAVSMIVAQTRKIHCRYLGTAPAYCARKARTCRCEKIRLARASARWWTSITAQASRRVSNSKTAMRV